MKFDPADDHKLGRVLPPRHVMMQYIHMHKYNTLCCPDYEEPILDIPLVTLENVYPIEEKIVSIDEPPPKLYSVVRAALAKHKSDALSKDKVEAIAIRKRW